jgi:predicted alpha-1,2-mannosidase
VTVLPAAAVPNGAALWVPLTDGASGSWLYSWAAHNGPDNRPRLHGVAVSHVPSPWMGDRDQLAVHLVPASGTRADGVPDGSLEARGLAFDHAAELARPHHYGVALDGGARVDVTPTDHGAVLRLTFPAGDAVGYVVLDAVGTEGAAEPGRPVRLRIEPETGTITGWSDHGSGLSVGRSRMYVVGRLDRPVLRAGRAAGDRPHARYATVDLSAGSGGRTVELRLATSFVGVEQAWRTFARELEGVRFAKVEARARAAWEERLGAVEVEGATDDQLTTLYSCLYRLNLYPTSQTEDAGEPGRPRPVHASPVLPHAGPSTDERTGAVVVDGAIFVNHGFWDTYRTCWPAYALLHPMLAGRLADGFVQQYREAGWVARWSSPGYADLMTGTSSDVAFADLLARGVSLPDPSAAYEAGLRNATVIPPHAGVGRKGQEHALLHGWVPREVHESVSWSLEGYVNDAGLAAMARQLAVRDGVSERRRRALLDEAAYLDRRALGYVHLFDRATGFFRGRGSDGTFVDPAGFDPAEWGGDYTESDAWNFAFHVPHDGAGLARLHGGPEGLAAVLERFFATPERADRPGSYGSMIHEMSEARDVRLGQLGQSNQVSHHVAYTWLAAGRPNRAQETVREILGRLWTGSELGQGYHGDEDNGEMSAWYVLSALGLYPLEVGSPRWALGSPLFRRAVVHRPGGDLVIEAPGAEDGHRYVAGVAVDGRELDAPVLDHRELVGGARVRFRMAAEPSGWGAERAAAAGPDRLPWGDVSGTGVWRRPGGRAVPWLADDELGRAVDVGPGGLTWSTGAGGHGHLLHAYTLVSAADGRPAPTSWRLSVRTAGGTWRDVDARDGEEFRWAAQLRPFVLSEPVAFDEVRLDLHDAGALAQVELLVE